jgi:hypothetical protein
MPGKKWQRERLPRLESYEGNPCIPVARQLVNLKKRRDSQEEQLRTLRAAIRKVDGQMFYLEQKLWDLDCGTSYPLTESPESGNMQEVQVSGES